jgi:hypothetical protein
MFQQTQLFSKKGISKNTGLVLFGITLLLILFESIFFWRESLFYLDSNKVLYELYQNEWFSYMHNRFAMAVTQVLPVIALKANLVGPKALFLLQSISFSFPPLITLSIVTFVFKDYRSAVLVLFLSVFGSIDIHYIKEWGGFAALFLIILTASFFQQYFKEEQKWHWLIAAFLIFLTINTHPTTACFFAMFFLVRLLSFSWKFKIAYLVMMFVSMVTVVVLNIYVDARISESLSLVFFERGVVVFLQHYLLQFEMIVLYFVCLGYLILARNLTFAKVLALFIPLVFLVLAFSFLVNYNYHERDAFYFECQVLLIVVSILYFPIYKLTQFNGVLLMVFLVAVIRFFTLNFGQDNRVTANILKNEKVLQSLTKQYPDKNVFLLDRSLDLTLPMFPDFFIHYESFLLSSYLFGNGNEKVIYLTNNVNIYQDDEGFPIFFNYTGPVGGEIDFNDPTTFGGFLDPTKHFPSLEISKETIQGISNWSPNK